MGNKQGVVDYNEFEAFSQNYTYIKKFNDIRFGDVKLLEENSTGAKIFQKDYTTHTGGDFKDTLAQIKKKAAVNHPNLIRIIGYTTKNEEAFCANYSKISVFYECYDHDLEQEISGRRSRNEYFPETEVWYILDSIITAGAHLEANEEAHGDIRPYNIFVSGTNEYKIADNDLFHGGSIDFLHAFSELESKGRYFSPAVFAFIGKKDKKEAIEHDKYKSDIFSLGMTILEAATLKNIDYLYDWQKHEIDFGKLDELIEEISEQKRYSPTLIQIIKLMIKADEQLRPNFLQLDSELANYRTDIKARKLKNEIETSETPIINVFGHDHIQLQEELEKFDPEETNRKVQAAIERSLENLNSDAEKEFTEKLKSYYEKYFGTSIIDPETLGGNQVSGSIITSKYGGPTITYGTTIPETKPTATYTSSAYNKPNPSIEKNNSAVNPTATITKSYGKVEGGVTALVNPSANLASSTNFVKRAPTTNYQSLDAKPVEIATKTTTNASYKPLQGTSRADAPQIKPLLSQNETTGPVASQNVTISTLPGAYAKASNSANYTINAGSKYVPSTSGANLVQVSTTSGEGKSGTQFSTTNLGVTSYKRPEITYQPAYGGVRDVKAGNTEPNSIVGKTNPSAMISGDSKYTPSSYLKSYK